MDVSVREGKRYEFGAFVLDPLRRVVTRHGTVVALTPTLFDTLLYLIEHPSRAVSKEELLDAIWPRKTVNEANISQTIFTLRRALAGAGEAEPMIVTAPGVGYRFACPVQVVRGGEAGIEVLGGLEEPLDLAGLNPVVSSDAINLAVGPGVEEEEVEEGGVAIGD